MKFLQLLSVRGDLKSEAIDSGGKVKPVSSRLKKKNHLFVWLLKHLPLEDQATVLKVRLHMCQ